MARTGPLRGGRWRYTPVRYRCPVRGGSSRAAPSTGDGLSSIYIAARVPESERACRNINNIICVTTIK